MIWATVSSWSCFCWLYRASPSLAAKNIINLILVLIIWWCPCIESSLVLLEEGVCYDQCVLLGNSISLCPASFHIPRPSLPVTPGVSWLPTFAFQSPIMKRTSLNDALQVLCLVTQPCPTLCSPMDRRATVHGILQARILEWVAVSFSNAWKQKVKVNLLSRVRLLVTPWTATYQAPPSMGFSRREYWSGLPLPSPVWSFKQY